MQWNLISQYGFLLPSHNSSCRHNQEIYCRYSVPKLTSHTPQCWQVLFCSIPHTIVCFFLNFLLLNRMCPIEVSTDFFIFGPNPSVLFQSPRSSRVPKLEVPQLEDSGNLTIHVTRPKVCAWICGKIPCLSMWKHHHVKMEPWHFTKLEISSFYGAFSNDFCGIFPSLKCFQDGEFNGVPFSPMFRHPKGSRVPQKHIWGGFIDFPLPSFPTLEHPQSHRKS